MARFITRIYLVTQFQNFFNKVVKPLIKGTVAKIKVNGELVEMDASDRSVNIEIPEGAEYSLAKAETAAEGFFATYHLTKNGENVGEAINIPKDYLVKEAVVKVVETENEPVEGYAVGEKYIDFTVNTKNKDGNETHLYINVGDIVKPLALEEVDPDTKLLNPLHFVFGKLNFEARRTVASVDIIDDLRKAQLSRMEGAFIQVNSIGNVNNANGLYKVAKYKCKMTAVTQNGIAKDMLCVFGLGYLYPIESILLDENTYIVKRGDKNFFEFEPHAAGYAGAGQHDAFRIFNEEGMLVDDGGDATTFVFEPESELFNGNDELDCYVLEPVETEEKRDINFGEGARPDVVINL